MSLLSKLIFKIGQSLNKQHLTVINFRHWVSMIILWVIVFLLFRTYDSFHSKDKKDFIIYLINRMSSGSSLVKENMEEKTDPLGVKRMSSFLFGF